MTARSLRHAFSMIEMLVVITIIGFLLAILLPAIGSARESARRAQCLSNLHQLGVATYSYEATNKTLPPGAISRMYPQDPTHPYTFYRWSALASLLPYMDLESLHKLLDINLPIYMPGPGYPIADRNQVGVAQSIPTFLCPSDSGQRPLTKFAPTNYVFCSGSGAGGGTPFHSDGMFFVNSTTKFAHLTNGASHTVAVSESLLGADTPFSPSAGFTSISPERNYKFVLSFTSSPALTDSQCQNAKNYNSTSSNGNDPRGFAWCSGEYRCATYNHYYTPNSPTCDCITSVTVDSTPPPAKPMLYSAYGWRAARSSHPGGVCVMLADSSARFVENTIDRMIWQGCAKRDPEGTPVDFP